jgi:DNA polymerase III epsilon subunit-like protein
MITLQYPTSYIAWDLETSGLNFKEDKILEIGLYRVENGEVYESKRWVLDNKIQIPQHITDINGMTNEIIEKEGQDPAVCISQFIDYVRDSEANLTHNGINFDIKFMVQQAKQYIKHDDMQTESFRDYLNKSAIDTAVIFKANLHGMKKMWNETFYEFGVRVMKQVLNGKYNLGVCCDELGIDRSSIVQHRALGDVELTHLVYQKLLTRI